MEEKPFSKFPDEIVPPNGTFKSHCCLMKICNHQTKPNVCQLNNCRSIKVDNGQSKQNRGQSKFNDVRTELLNNETKVYYGQSTKLPENVSKLYDGLFIVNGGQSKLHEGQEVLKVVLSDVGDFLKKTYVLSEKIRSITTWMQSSSNFSVCVSPRIVVCSARIVIANFSNSRKDFYNFALKDGAFKQEFCLKLFELLRHKVVHSPDKQLKVTFLVKFCTGFLINFCLHRYLLYSSEVKHLESNHLNRSVYILQNAPFREPLVFIVQSLREGVVDAFKITSLDLNTLEELGVVVNRSLTSKLFSTSVNDNTTEYIINESILNILDNVKLQNGQSKFMNKLNNTMVEISRFRMDTFDRSIVAILIPSFLKSNLQNFTYHNRKNSPIKTSLIGKEIEELNFHPLYEPEIVLPNDDGQDITFCEQETQTCEVGVLHGCPEGLNDQIKNYNHKLQQENSILKLRLQKFIESIKGITNQFDTENRRLVEEKSLLENEVLNLKDKLQQLEKEHDNVLLEFGKLSFETAVETNKASENKRFQKLFFKCPSVTSLQNENGSSSSFNSRRSNNYQGINLPKFNRHAIYSKYTSRNTICTCSLSSVSASAREENIESGSQVGHQNQLQSSQEGRSSDLAAPNDTTVSFPVEVQEARKGEFINLTTQPSSSTSANVFNAYQLFLLTISNRLLLNDIAMLKKWACEVHAVRDDLSATEVIFLLDQKKVINSVDLSQLHRFFDSIGRFDLIHLTDVFTSGDYDYLRRLIGKPAKQAHLHVTNLHCDRTVQMATTEPNPSSNRTTNANNDQGLAETRISNRSDAISRSDISNINLGRTELVISGPKPDGPTTNNIRGISSQQNSAGTPALPTTSRESDEFHKFNTHATKTNHSCSHNRHAQNCSNDNDQESQWLCSHYKRRCFVKFECCDQYWPCHRCHNNASTCGRKKLKSRDTTMVKCVTCGHEQQFGENGQFCVACKTQFADFYCGLCKHLTGMDDHPYHCDKCGICRIHGDRSFHCDVCGVCLDVQLRGNHKCRPDSAHDGCGICLEDAFTGCQILPCSHKVHKHCANEMIQRGMTRCPICRESFAHKLQRTSIAKRGRRRK